MEKNILINISDFLYKKYGNKYSYEIGKVLSFKDRVKYDYNIECYKNNKEFSELLSLYYNEKNFIEKLINNDEIDYILKNINEIIRDSSTLNNTLFTYLKNNIDKIDEDKMNEIKELLSYNLSEYYPNNSKEDTKGLIDKIEEVAKNQNLTIFDIEQNDYGAFSKIYKLGNKIIKIGYKRECIKIPDNNRILVPEFKGYVGKDYLEITYYLENEPNKVKFNDLLEVYEDLKEQDITWLDPNSNNVARINKEALEYINNNKEKKKELDIEENERYIDKPLNVGDYVIIDLDHLFRCNETERIKHVEQNLTEYIIDKRKSLELKIEEKKKTIE